MVINTRHTGIVVLDLERSILFYEGLGLKVLARMVEKGSYIDTLVDLNNTRLEWAKLRLPDQSLLELLQYHSNTSEIAKSALQESNRIGCSHVAFTVNNIEETIQYIQQNGGSIKNNYQVSPDGNVKVIYCYDPEGNILEIVQELK